jgi:signal transduction histidine kinase
MACMTVTAVTTEPPGVAPWPHRHGLAASRAHLLRVAVAAAAILAVYGSWQAVRWGGAEQKTLTGDLFFVPLNLFAVVTSWGAARRCRLQPRLMQCWQLISVALALYLLGDVAQSYTELVAHDRPFPSLADVGYLAFYPLLFAALLRFPSAPRSGRQQLVLVLDCALVALSGAVPIWYVSLGPTLEAGGGNALTEAVSVAYPLGDMVLLIGLATLLFRRVPASMRTPLRLIGVGLLGFVVTDLIYGWITLHASYAGGDLVDSGWMVSLGFFVLAGAAQPVVSGSPSAVRVRASYRQRLSWLPYVGLASTLGFAVDLERHRGLTVVVIIGAAATLAVLVSIRQLIVQSELLTTQRQLREAQSDRAVLLDRTLRGGDDERTRIAAELHDGPVQRLAAVAYLLERAARLGRRGEPDRTLTLLDEAIGELSGEIIGLRRLMSDLRPPVLDQSGLDNALRDHLLSLFGETDIQIELVSLLDDERLPADTETVFYRVAQEALLNISRHAAARRVLVRLERGPGVTLLRVEDDGVGFSADHARTQLRDGHFGLIGMRERVELGGGTWEIDSTPGAGTRITATLPDPVLPSPSRHLSATSAEVPV